MYTPQLRTNEANSLYMAILDYFFMCDDPQYSRLHRIRGKILVITDNSDKNELTKYFESETRQKIDYFKSAY